MIIPLSRPDCKYLSAVATKLPQALITPAAAVVLSFGNYIRSFTFVYKTATDPITRTKRFAAVTFFRISVLSCPTMVRNISLLLRKYFQAYKYDKAIYFPHDTSLFLRYVHRYDVLPFPPRPYKHYEAPFPYQNSCIRLYLKVLRSCALHYEI